MLRAPLLASAAAALVLATPAPAAPAAPPAVEARAYLVVNGATGETLLARNAGERLPIASITKLMTVLVALERTNPSDLAVVQPDAAVGGSSAHLRAGEQLSVRDLVAAALIQSANDAAETLADHVGRGDERRFVGLMNVRAKTLGLHDTHFVRPDGLDAYGHLSTARDVTKLARIAMQKPLVRELVVMRSASIAGGRSLYTWNDLLGRFPDLVGVKTGHTTGAGWCQVAAARGAGFTIYATILGSPSRRQRNADLAELLAWGLSQYRLGEVVRAGRVYATARTGYGRGPVRLVAEKRARASLRVDRSLVERVVAPETVTLPVRKGQRLGEVRVYDGKRLLGRSPLVAAETVALPGAAGKVRWYAGRAAKRAWGWIT